MNKFEHRIAKHNYVPKVVKKKGNDLMPRTKSYGSTRLNFKVCCPRGNSRPNDYGSCVGHKISSQIRLRLRQSIMFLYILVECLYVVTVIK